MRLALAKDLKRKREGKDTEFEINGRLLPRQKMQRFMVRKELSEEDVIRSDARKSTSTSSRVPLLTMKATPPYVTYHTPHPVEDDDVTNTLASISLSQDEVMADACATHGEGTENLFDRSKILEPDKQREKHASASESILPSSNEVSEDISKILERNEAWLERRLKARNNPELILAYARLIWTYKKVQRPTTLDIDFSIWKSYFERRLKTLGSDPYKEFWIEAPVFHRSLLLYYIDHTFESLNTSFLDHWTTGLLPSIIIWRSGVPYFATEQDYDKLLRKAQSNSSVSRSEPVFSSIREEAFSELQSIPTASPFERWSQRYDISSSPNWIRSYMSPSNPLSLLTPAPIGTPWEHIPKPSPRLSASPGHGSRVFNKNNTDIDGDNFHSLPARASNEDFTLIEVFPDSDQKYQRWVPNIVVQTPVI
jgi:hypothetical protein